MHLPIVGRRIAVVSSAAAALLAAGYAASEHHHTRLLEQQIAAAAVATASPSPAAVAATTQEAPPAVDCSALGGQITAADNDLPKVRQAAREYVQEKRPNARIEGVFTAPVTNNWYLAVVDATEDGQRRNAVLYVFQYVRKNGGQYWRAMGLGSDRAAAALDRIGQPALAGMDLSAADAR